MQYHKCTLTLPVNPYNTFDFVISGRDGTVGGLSGWLVWGDT